MGAHRTPFTEVPTELVTTIFSLLPNLYDAFALAATCHRIKRIWSANSTAIYHEVAPRSIPCAKYAHRFLSDCGGPSLGFPLMNPESIRNIARNATIVEKSMKQFEEEIVSRVRSKPSEIFCKDFSWTKDIASGYTKEEIEACYDKGARRHPPYLTSSERSRFIRLYYQIWGMTMMNDVEQQCRLRSMSLKQLYRLLEMSRLSQKRNCEEAESPSARLDVYRGAIHPVTNWSRRDDGDGIEQEIWKHIEERYESLHKCKIDNPEIYAKAGGYYPFVVIWDHWKPSLKSLVCGGQRLSDDGSGWVYRQEDLWEETSDEGSSLSF